MVALNVVSRFRHTNDQRATRRKLSSDMHHDALLRQLPALLDLPLPIIGSDGAPRHLDDTLHQAGYVLLSGPIGSGRGLALQQIAQHLVQTNHKLTPVLINLSRIDDNRTNPLQLVSQIQQANRQARKPAAQPLAERLVDWVLLVSGLEELPLERQDVWRKLLQAAPQEWQQTRLIVATHRDEPRWPGYTALAIAQPTNDLIERWVDLLAPIACRPPLIAALLNGGALTALDQRLYEIALLVLVASQNMMPTNRARLYQQALLGLYQLDEQQHSQRQISEGLALLAAYDERPQTIVEGLVELSAAGELCFTPPIMRLYFAARQLVAEQRYDLLGMLDQAERREIARFCASLAEQVAPLYNALWNQGKPDAEAVLILGVCLRERPAGPIGWTIRIIGALALLARDTKPQRSQANTLVRQNRPALETAFAALVQATPERQQAIVQLIQLLPTDLAAYYAERLTFAQNLPEALAWNLADVLAAYPNGNGAPSAVPAEPGSRARWMYLQAIRSADQRLELIDAVDASAIGELAESGIDESRLLRAAAALAEDPRLPTSYRIAALGLLAQSSQPTALTVIERACYDSDGLVRQAALGHLSSRDAERGQAALSRAALDTEAPDQTRIGAIEHLAVYLATESQTLLARSANDQSLPLYGRLLSIAALGADAAGSLAMLATNQENPLAIRAFAATRLAGCGDLVYTSLLHGLLDDNTTPRELLIGICAGLGHQDEQYSQKLALLLESAMCDSDVVVAISGALGRLANYDSVGSLGELLGAGAWNRFEPAVPSEWHRLPAEAALTNELPAALAVNLQEALDRATAAAERPTTLHEFLLAEAERIRRAAAAAIAQIGGNNANATLLAALIDEAAVGTGEPLVAALAQTGDNSAAALGHMVASDEYSAMARWVAVQHLRDHAEGNQPMYQALSQPTTDPFIRGALAEALGKRGAITALPLLRQLADEASSDSYLRSQAIIGLGLLNEPATEVVLMRLLSDQHEDETLRGLAATHLPSGLSNEGRRLLREMLRRERQPAALTAGVLQTLGRVRDNESLPLLLRFAQDERPDVARAALSALDDLGDGSVAPVLVRVAQNPSTERATRLRAIGTLLMIGGDGYRPLMRSYIEDGSLPLRLQAVDHLIRANTPTADLLTLLAAPNLPQPLRARVLRACATDQEAQATLLRVANDQHEPIAMRVQAVAAMQQHADASVVEQLAALAAAAPEAVRLASIDALGAIGGSFACVTLSHLAEGLSQSAVIRRAALRALHHAISLVVANQQLAALPAQATHADS